MDRKTVLGLTNLWRGIIASSIVCGLTANTTTEGLTPSGISSAVSTIVTPSALANCSIAVRLGSTTYIASSTKPVSSQPANIAPPILPQPTKINDVISKLLQQPQLMPHQAPLWVSYLPRLRIGMQDNIDPTR